MKDKNVNSVTFYQILHSIILLTKETLNVKFWEVAAHSYLQVGCFGFP